MDLARLLGSLAQDYASLRSAVVEAKPDARVPNCPDWTAADLARHVAEVYLHKVECIRQGRFPDSWPPEPSDPDPVVALDAAYATLTETFAAHDPADFAATFVETDQTVGFWIRRMAQETVIHRVDAEQAAGREVSPIQDDLAIDGIDEILTVFIGYETKTWPHEYAQLLAEPDDRPLRVSTGDEQWILHAMPDGVSVTRADGHPGATVSGAAGPLLRWLWNRADDSAVRFTGDLVLLNQFHAIRVAVTQ